MRVSRDVLFTGSKLGSVGGKRPDVVGGVRVASGGGCVLGVGGWGGGGACGGGVGGAVCGVLRGGCGGGGGGGVGEKWACVGAWGEHQKENRGCAKKAGGGCARGGNGCRGGGGGGGGKGWPWSIWAARLFKAGMRARCDGGGGKPAPKGRPCR